MILEAPPSRYRVEERGGRLVVIDRQMGTETVTRAEPVAVKPHVLTGERGSALRLRATPKVPPRAAAAMTSGAPPTADFLVNLAMFFTQAAPAGRVLRTQRWFDASAPRQAVLDPSQTRRLGALVLFAGVAAMIVLIVAMFGGAAAGAIAAIIVFQLLRPVIRAGLQPLIIAAIPCDQPRNG